MSHNLWTTGQSLVAIVITINTSSCSAAAAQWSETNLSGIVNIHIYLFSTREFCVYLLLVFPVELHWHCCCCVVFTKCCCCFPFTWETPFTSCSLQLQRCPQSTSQQSHLCRVDAAATVSLCVCVEHARAGFEFLSGFFWAKNITTKYSFRSSNKVFQVGEIFV